MNDSTQPVIIKDFDTLLAVVRLEYKRAIRDMLPGGEMSVKVPVEKNRRYGTLSIMWEVQPGILNFVLYFPARVKEKNRAQLIQKVSEVNPTLAVLGFIVGTDVISFRTHAFLDQDGAIPTNIVMRTIRQCILMFEMFLEPFLKISEMRA